MEYTPISLFAADWGNGEKTVFTTRINGEIARYPFKGSLRKFVETHKNVRLVLESSFESYDHNQRNQIIDIAIQNGIDMRCISSRMTGNSRCRSGVAKTDENDSRVIFEIAEHKIANGHVIKPVVKYQPKTGNWYTAFDAFRRAAFRGPEVKQILAVLPDFRSIPEELKEALGDKQNYSNGFVVPLVMKATEFLRLEEDKSRKNFEKHVGFYEDGYPNFLRSTSYRRVATIENRVLKGVSDLDRTKLPQMGGKKSLVRLNGEAWWPIHKEKMKLVRKSIRWIFYQVQNPQPICADNPDSVKDKLLSRKRKASTEVNNIPKRASSTPVEAVIWSGL